MYTTIDYLPEFFREKPLPNILLNLLDSALNRDVLGTINILENGGLIQNDDVGLLRLKEYGAEELESFSYLGDTPTQPERLLAISKLTESFSRIKGQKKAIQLILQLLGMTGEIIEYDDEVRGTVTTNQGLLPGQVVVVGQINPEIAADLLAANPNKTAEVILEELIDLFSWAHIRFAGILITEEFFAEWLYNPLSELDPPCITQIEYASFCPQVIMPKYSYHPTTNVLLSGGERVRIDKFLTGFVKHKVSIGPYGCTDLDGNLQEQWKIGDEGFVVGGDFFCSLKEMEGVGAENFEPLGFYESSSGQQWQIGDPNVLVGGCFPAAICFASTLELEIS